MADSRKMQPSGADVKSFIESGTFQVRLKNKDEIVKFWTEIRGGG